MGELSNSSLAIGRIAFRQLNDEIRKDDNPPKYSYTGPFGKIFQVAWANVSAVH